MNKNWLWVLGIFAVGGIIITFILRLVTPRQLVIPKTDFIATNQTSGSTTFANIRFTGHFSQTANVLPVASIQASQTSLDFIRNNLIKKYQLQQVAGLTSVWQGPEYTLAYNPHADDFKFYYWPENYTQELLNSYAQKIESAQQFVRENFPNLGLIAQTNSVRYLNGLGEYEETTPEKATIMQIDFTYMIEGVPIYLEHERAAVVIVTIDSQNVVRSVYFQPYFVSFVPTEQKTTLISLETALENINNHSEAAIVYAYEETTGEFSINKIQSGELKTVGLQYRADLKTGLAYPFYHFAGELINADGQTIQAEIITPAVAVQE